MLATKQALTKEAKILAVRLPELEVRKLKSLAASRGVSLQEAVHQALESWSAELHKKAPEPLDALEGSLSDVDTDGLLRREREAELAKEQRWR